MPRITLPSGKFYESADGESLLDAALRSEISLEHSCRTGRCNSCRAQVKSGLTVAIHEEVGLSQAEREAGWILTCSRSATSDVELVVQDLGAIRLHPAKTLPCRVQSIEHLSHDVMKVVLRLPPTQAFEYHAGQYIEVFGKDGLRRSYSVANACTRSKQIELHIRQVPGGAMSAYWFEQVQINDLLRLRGPLGTFFLRDVAGKDLVFLATGTGMAPVKAMLEGLLMDAAGDKNLLPRTVNVYWGGREKQDLYWNPGSLDISMKYVPVLSRADAAWTGARGYVHQVFLSDRPDLSQAVVYACGSDAMIQSARQQLLEAGLEAQHFHADAFVCSA